MKNIILIIALIILFEDITCNQDILSKFKQNGYKVKDKRTEVIRVNKDIFHKFEIKTFKYNRTTPVVNGTIHVKVNVADKLELVVQAFKFLSNEYRFFPIRFQVNLQKIYVANTFGVHNSGLCGNLTSFIFHKDVIYHFCNFVPNENYLPPLIPVGLYKIEALLLYLNQEAAFLNLYGEVHIPMAYP